MRYAQRLLDHLKRASTSDAVGAVGLHGTDALRAVLPPSNLGAMLEVEVDHQHLKSIPITARELTILLPIGTQLARVAVRHKDGRTQELNGSPICLQLPSCTTDRQATASQENTGVTVVIPMVRDVITCIQTLQSVLSSKTETPFTVLVVNDGCHDHELTQTLRAIPLNKRLRIIERPVNGGFIAAVNHALNVVGQDDVILLNSDCLVSNYWVDRLKAAAYQDPSIAGVCPLSNNAELLSIPESMHQNVAGNQSFTDAVNQWLTSQTKTGLKLSTRQPMEIPAGIGFCWYIKATALAKVGRLEELLLHRGYAEDTDLSERFTAAGLKTVAASTVYVTHLGEKSFGSEKSALALQNQAVIRTLYPDHDLAYQDFLGGRPLATLSRELQRHVIAQGVLPNVQLVQTSQDHWERIRLLCSTPTIGFIEDVNRKKSVYQMFGHRIPGLTKICFSGAAESREFLRFKARLEQEFGASRLLNSCPSKTALSRKTLQERPALKIRQPLRIGILILRSIADGFAHVKELAQIIDQRNLPIRLIVFGKTFNDSLLASFECIELAGDISSNELADAVRFTSCSVITDPGHYDDSLVKRWAEAHNVRYIEFEALTNAATNG